MEKFKAGMLPFPRLTLQEPASALQLSQRNDIVGHRVLIQGIVIIPSLFFLLDEPGFHKNFHMMGDRRLGKVHNMLET